MALWARFREALAGAGTAKGGEGAGRERVSGYPTSSNRASSLHLSWELPPGTGPVVAVSARLTVDALPPVAELYFWALQASFRDGPAAGTAAPTSACSGTRPTRAPAPSTGAGTRRAAAILPGSESALPSGSGNANTRDYWWEPAVPHLLTIERAAGGGWAGSVDGTHVRTLAAGGDRLDGLMVWSEVFARCDDPPVAVRWSGFRATLATGEVVSPVALRVNYQGRSQGGCDNTSAIPDGDGVVQVTNTPRQVPTGARIELA